jgi:methylmalonyl-CoA mutase C-terminal domain/subunit
MKEQRVIRVLIAKPGFDGHDRGAKVLTLGLKDEGMEVYIAVCGKPWSK